MDTDEPVGDSVAITVKTVFKSYGRGKSAVRVLEDLDMTVPKGAIYGLLGPSGCGKTTLLRCIIGRLSVDAGWISTLGNKPGALGHGVPGEKVGYMPQELALYQEFSISETLFYFGRLHRMKRQYINERISFLVKFLHLPEPKRLIKQLSGGQQRRTSFAIALLQEPELLILDEPTVGVDPLLRQRIWEHLLDISQRSHTTIIITTHYVEEARQAHVVGLMRNGKLLAESPPNRLLETYHSQSLETVFLKLCQDDQVGDIEQHDDMSKRDDPAPVIVKKRRVPNTGSGSPSELDPLLSYKDEMPEFPKGPSGIAKVSYFIPSAMNIFALIIKNILVLKGNVGALMFEFILPALQITLFCLCIGRTPYDLPMAVVNMETGGTCPAETNVMTNISCNFLSAINDHTVVQHNYGNNLSEAIANVKNGKNWGVIEIPSNFTENMLKRFTDGKPDNATLNGSTVKMHMDMTNQQISITIQAEILNAMTRFLSEELAAVGANPAMAQLPIQYEDPIYGEATPSFTNFMAPGIILSITFFMATGLTALSFVIERKQGLMDRSFVSGVTTLEIMVGHICTQFMVMCVQVALLLVVALAIFKVTYEGPLILVIILTLMQGLIGMAIGLLISTACDNETGAIQLALGSVYPNLLLSGIIWPIQGMPVWLRYVSVALPMTYAAEAMRCILARGWTLTYMPVWRGFLVSIGWGWGLFALSALILMLRKE